MKSKPPRTLIVQGSLEACGVFLERLVLVGGSATELVHGLAPKVVLYRNLLHTPHHRSEVLIVRRIGRPRDADGVDLNGYFHNLDVFY
ncbi:MAG: hypothetical protein J6I49_06805 [Bacteroidales bacterium]|nr:hypothetical protein [Bacteroidales bacterium]